MTEAAGNQVPIVLAGDRAVVRSELRRLLDAATSLEVVSEVGDTESALAAVALHRPAAFVLDLERPGDGSSLDTIRAVAQASPETSVVVVVAREDPRFVRHALRAACRNFQASKSLSTGKGTA